MLIKSPLSGSENLYDLVETVSGGAVLSGYKTYDVIDSGDGTRYVYAETADSVVEIFVIE